MTSPEKLEEASSNIEVSGEAVESLTPVELNQAVEMYAQQHLEYLKSRGVDMDATEPAKAEKWMDYMNSYNNVSRKGAELNPLIAREDLRKYEEEKAKRQGSAE